MVVLFFVIIFSSMGFGLVLPPFVFVASNLGASEMLAGFIVSSFAMGQFLATPLWGKLSDRYGRKPILILSMIGSTVAYLSMAWSDYAGSLWMLLGARFLTGLMAGNFAAATAYVADITPPEKRAQGMGMVGGAVSIGFMAGPAIGGLLSGNTADSASLFMPSIAAAVMSVLTLFAILLFLKESRTPQQRAEAVAASERQTGEKNSGSFVQILRRPVLAQMVLMGFLVFFAMTNFETTFPFWAQSGFAWGPRQVGFCFMYLGFIVMLTQMFIAGRLVPIFGEGKLLLAATCSYSFGLLWMATMPFALDPAIADVRAFAFDPIGLTMSEVVMLFGITFTAAGGAMFNTASTSWVSKQAGDHERGTVLGLFQSAGWLGRSVGPTVSGFLFMTYGPNTPLFAGALLMVPVFFIVAYIRRRHAEDTA
jgi:DHA1 family tetracycline resistance protein-like MFS transporter